MSKLVGRRIKEDPKDAKTVSHKFLVRGGYVRPVSAGIYSLLPLGKRIVEKIEAIIREEMNRIEGQEVLMPVVLPADLWKESGRYESVGAELLRFRDRNDKPMILAMTHEEGIVHLVRTELNSYKQLPVMLYQIQTKYRDEARPRAGLLRGREFVMKDAYSFDVDDAGLEAAYQRQREAYQRIFTRLGLEHVIVAAMSGAMGGSRSEEFLTPTPIGEDTFVRSAGGYAANVEAVTTPVPEPVPYDDAPAAHVEDTPDTPTIDSLVSLANERFPRADRAWTAADTLKNVVLVLTHPDGERELLVVGLPGDREVDLKRLEAAVSPAEVAPATEADFAAHPELVKGYIGPAAVGAANTGREDAVRYLLDPRVVTGTRWITGANVEGRHVFDLVAGRDFAADGTIEAAEVRAGDPAPDGSGPLELARGIEMGHIFALGRKYSEALGLKVLDENGKAVTVTMGSYGIGISRAVAALAEANHDDAGLAWPIQVAPVQVHLVATGKDDAVFQAAAELAAELHGAGVEVLYDDRPRVSPGVKFADAELLGAPVLVVVGRGLAEGNVELRLRRAADAEALGVELREGRPVAEQVPVADAAHRVSDVVCALLDR